MPDAECVLCGKVGKRAKWAKDQNDPLCIFHDCVLVAVGKPGKGDELRSAKGGKLLCHSLAPKVF